MSFTAYKASTIGPRVEMVEVISETAQFITVAGPYGGTRREKKFTDWNSFHSTFNEAKGWLVKVAEHRIVDAREDLERAQVWLDIVKNIKESTK